MGVALLFDSDEAHFNKFAKLVLALDVKGRIQSFLFVCISLSLFCFVY